MNLLYQKSKCSAKEKEREFCQKELILLQSKIDEKIEELYSIKEKVEYYYKIANRAGRLYQDTFHIKGNLNQTEWYQIAGHSENPLIQKMQTKIEFCFEDDAAQIFQEIKEVLNSCQDKKLNANTLSFSLYRQLQDKEIVHRENHQEEVLELDNLYQKEKQLLHKLHYIS